MIPALKARHDEVLQQLAAKYTAQGYAVEVEPRFEEHPGSLVDLDIIARRGSETVLIEIKLASSAAPTPELARYAELAHRNGWRFVIAVADARDVDEVELPTVESVRSKIAETRSIDPQSTAAPLLAWSVLEAAARRAVATSGTRVARSSSPTALIQQLAASGLVTTDEERRLHEFATMRNGFAHGVWDSPRGTLDVEAVLGLAERLLTGEGPRAL